MAPQHENDPTPPTPFSRPAGFPGGGRTTVQDHPVLHPAPEKAAVIITAIGASGLDHDLETSIGPADRASTLHPPTTGGDAFAAAVARARA